MKKLLSYAAAASLLIASCTEKPAIEDELSKEPAPAQRACAAMEVLEQQIKADPKLRVRMESIERFTNEMIQSGRINEQGKIEIPVIVNVIYRTASENISDAQIQSQIDVLNEDFNATNSDVSQVPSAFAGRVADIDIQFVLEGINRKFSSKKSWGTNDAMKKTSQGGLDPTDPTHMLNFWVVNKITSGRNTILGYAQFPGGSPATDGVVVGYNFFGRTGTLSAPFNKGRTATHEVGHWLNLRHIWGDQTCGTDLVDDTPTHNTYNFGCPAYPHLSTCSGTPVEMTMNYMDYTDDACMFMFTTGQKNRAAAIFGTGGPRATFAQ
jgi:hypothetical protein